MKRILVALILILALYACSGPRADSAGIINGERIPYPQFVRSYQEHTANFQLHTGRVPSSEEKKAIFNETWQNITKHSILKEHFKRYDITVSEQEVIDTLLSNIPESIKTLSGFQVNGKFDEKLYYQSVRYDSPVKMGYFRRNYYEYYVPMQKLKEKLIDEEVARSKKAKKLSEIAVSTADFDLMVFDPADMDPIISDNEIEAYYQQNLERFALDPIYSIQYISLPVDPSEHDLAYTTAIADSIYAELNQGKSIETIIFERQEYVPGLSVFNPGFVRVENMDPALMKALDYLPDNSYSKPTPVGKGFALYQKLQRTKSMISYRALQIPPILDPATINAHYPQAEGALNLAKEIGLEAAATELDLPLTSLPRVSTKDLWHSDIAIIEQVNDQLMIHKKGDFLPALYSTLTGNWIVLQLTENQVNRVSPLKEVRGTITSELRENRKLTLARHKAREWIAQNPAWDVQADSELYHLEQYQKGGIHSEYRGLSLDICYIKAMQRHLDKLPLQPESLGHYEIILIPRVYYPAKDRKIDPQALRDLYIQQLEPDWFNRWMQDHLDSAKVQIFVKP
jgi:hypothetical protein